MSFLKRKIKDKTFIRILDIMFVFAILFHIGAMFGTGFLLALDQENKGEFCFCEQDTGTGTLINQTYKNEYIPIILDFSSKIFWHNAFFYAVVLMFYGWIRLGAKKSQTNLTLLYMIVIVTLWFTFANFVNDWGIILGKLFGMLT